MSGTEASLTQRLGLWSSGLQLADIPDALQARAKLLLLDAIGLRLAAERSDLAAALVLALGGPHPAERDSLTPALRALREGLLIASLDFDDTHEESLIHPSAAIVPAAFAAARGAAQSGAALDGPVLLTALVAGYEVASRVAAAAPGQFHRRGFHPTGVLCALGAAAAAARARGLDAGRTGQALGLAASVAGGLTESLADGTDGRFLNAGQAAMNGVLAAALAAEGVTGPVLALEGPGGLYPAHLGPETAVDLERVAGLLGRRWESLGIQAKPYPTGYVTHGFIDALFALMRESPWEPGAIAEIQCLVGETAARLVCLPIAAKQAPVSVAAARVALPHILAEAGVFGDLGAVAFSEARRTDARVTRLAAAVRYQIQDETAPDRLRILFNDGSAAEREVRPHVMTRDGILAKFDANVEGEGGRGARMRDLSLALGSLGPGEVAELLTPAF